MQMQPRAIFHDVLSLPGSKVPSDAKKDTLALASIAHNTDTSSAGVSAGLFDSADSNDSTHVAPLLIGKIVELSLHPAVWLSGVVEKGDTIVVLNVMKMESVVVVPGGRRALMRGWLLCAGDGTLRRDSCGLAIRIIRTAQELGWSTVAIYTAQDSSHAAFAGAAVKRIVDIAKRAQSTHYAQATVSSARVLRSPPFFPPLHLDDQIAARARHCAHLLSCDLAVAQDVPIAPGMHVKLLAGGGGRRIRVIRPEEGVEEAFKTDEDSQLLSHKALSGPVWMHIEVHMGGATGDVVHLCELQCSVQRRFQKLVEMAPFTNLPHHKESNSTRACRLDKDGAIQPQMEELTNLDIVRIQLLLSSATLPSLDLTPASISPTQGCAIHSRLTVDEFRFSAGAIPAQLHRMGRGVRVDTWICSVPSCLVGTHFDSLLAEIVVHGRALAGATQRAVRALRETIIGNDNGENGEGGRCDTMWSERELGDALRIRTEILKPKSRQGGLDVEKVPSASGSGSRAARYPTSSSAPGSKATSVAKKHASIAYNAFPTNISDTLQSIFSSSPLVFSVNQGQLTGQTPATSKTSYTVHAFGIRHNERIAVHVTTRRSKAEEILGCGLKEHFDLGARYDLGVGIFRMHFYVVMGHPGSRVARKRKKARIGFGHRVAKGDTQAWFRQHCDGIIQCHPVILWGRNDRVVSVDCLLTSHAMCIVYSAC
ncbi:hypothetical protein FIBSPDRAFT_957067 [Athelia psychrophila]|uniref:Biotin carboxylation domain-containing protein n=1 Tax=Athelia psychrophila TaxID=1759441 RepID=A0A166G9V4_9AGAM|nr:hypothetical protein FIBSPDRAFT_957067 [Fibularhizoctonia sp. CBS 109695]